MNNFSYWKLVRAQWSWKNELKGVLLNFCITVPLTLYFLIAGKMIISPEDKYVVGAFVFWSALSVWLIFVSQILKVVILGSSCILVTYIARNSPNTETKLKAIKQYNEMLTWRQ